MTCTVSQILLGWSSQRWCDGKNI